MMKFIQSASDRLLREIADDYIRQGYAVIIRPLIEDLPEFLHEFHPDLLVITPEEKIIVEVKGSDKPRPEGFFERLDKAIQSHPGWRHQFVLSNAREKELREAFLPMLTEEEIEERLEAGQRLVEQGLLDSALLVTWGAIEGTLRRMASYEKLMIPNQGAGALITVLYTEGSLSRADYDDLMRTREIRNRAAQGFQVCDITPKTIETARKIAMRQLNRLERLSRRRKKAA
jgi:hypothetical protein